MAMAYKIGEGHGVAAVQRRFAKKALFVSQPLATLGLGCQRTLLLLLAYNFPCTL
jgi:hypothetical protein